LKEESKFYIEKLEEKEEFKTFNRFAFFIPLILLSAINWGSYHLLSKIDNTLKIQILMLISLLYSVVWLFWVKFSARGKKYVVKSRCYLTINRISNLVNGGIALLFTTIFGIILTNHWDEICGWLNKIKDTLIAINL
ncbi:MAG: hypothetical protein ACU84H_10190, partial [Gammaproteobacteria bacterium]